MSKLYCPSCGNYLMAGDGELRSCNCGWKQPESNTVQEFDFDYFNDGAWLDAIASQVEVHGVTAATIAKVALELRSRLLAAEAQLENYGKKAKGES